MLFDQLSDAIQVLVQPIRLGVIHALVVFEWDLAGNAQQLLPVQRVCVHINTPVLLQKLPFWRHQEVEEKLHDILKVPGSFVLGCKAFHAS